MTRVQSLKKRRNEIVKFFQKQSKLTRRARLNFDLEDTKLIEDLFDIASTAGDMRNKLLDDVAPRRKRHE